MTERDETFEKWVQDYALTDEPNYCEQTYMDCKAAWQASRQQALTEAADMVHKGGNFRMALAIRSLASPIGDKA